MKAVPTSSGETKHVFKFALSERLILPSCSWFISRVFLLIGSSLIGMNKTFLYVFGLAIFEVDQTVRSIRV